MTSGYFEDIEVGDSRNFVSKAEIIQFAKQYDPRPFHVDEEAAARSVFAGLSASAAHTFAIFISLSNKYQPPFRALAGLGYDELRLPNNVPKSILVEKTREAAKCYRHQSLIASTVVAGSAFTLWSSRLSQS
ncbi:MaoC/PaaZ C-terminal domain-containing protein [Bradyrhizobium lablabi]|uniref:MaoC/PaaZ C-terminal domain-containing protein n=1 Tax=Bradyrhizobium lablabi TaxID=722472 RepID=UPI0012E37815|nr:MaoC/PaaZ C-terminal domain-containing protein [Bradyrhizobium lablabi]